MKDWEFMEIKKRGDKQWAMYKRVTKIIEFVILVFCGVVVGLIFTKGSYEKRVEMLEEDLSLVKEHEAELAKVNAKIERWLKISGDHMSGMD